MSAPGSPRRADSTRPDALFAGKYRLIRMLGKGGMGEVWLAEEEGPRNFRRRVALKKLLSKAEIGDYAYESFFAEAHVIARLDHPNIVRLIELGVAEDTVFLALDYVDGPTLDRVVRKGGAPLSPRVAAYVGREVARALEAVHSLCDDHGQNLGVVHRDISPANILIARDARVRLTDFGIARISGGLGGEKTETGVFKGKLPYMPPEQARGEPFDHRADVFSLGITLMEALTGRRVRKAETQTQLMMKVATMPVPRVHDLLPEVPQALADAIDGATTFDPARRTQDAGALAADMDRALWSMGPSAEQEARAELKQRVEAALVAMGEPLTGAHRQGASTPSARAVSTTPVAGPGTPVSEVYAKSAAPVTIEPKIEPKIEEVGPPSSHSAPTVLERAARPPVSSGGVAGVTPEPQARPPAPLAPAEPAAAPPPRRRGPLLAIVASAAVALAGAAIWLGTRPPGDVAPPPESAPPAPTSVAPGPAPSPEAQPTAAAQPTAPQPTAAAPEPTAAPTDAAQPTAPPPTGKAAPPRTPGQPAPSAPSVPNVGEASGPGTLQVVVLPWADVSVDGKPMGTTPIAPIQLPPGPHSVALRNAELGASRSFSVVIKPGQPTLLRVDLRRTDSP